MCVVLVSVGFLDEGLYFILNVHFFGRRARGVCYDLYAGLSAAGSATPGLRASPPSRELVPLCLADGLPSPHKTPPLRACVEV